MSVCLFASARSLHKFTIKFYQIFFYWGWNFNPGSLSMLTILPSGYKMDFSIIQQLSYLLTLWHNSPWRAWNLRLGTHSLKSQRTCALDFMSWKNPLTSAGFEPTKLGSRDERVNLRPTQLSYIYYISYKDLLLTF